VEEETVGQKNWKEQQMRLKKEQKKQEGGMKEQH
jgi:hypothetical protein